MEVNLPIGPGGPDERSPDFLSGKNAEILWKVRNILRGAAAEEGYEVTGCGIGAGGEQSYGSADIGLIVDGVRVEITIDLPKPRQ